MVGSSPRWRESETFPRKTSGLTCGTDPARVRPSLLVGLGAVQRPQCGRCTASNPACKFENARAGGVPQVSRTVILRGAADKVEQWCKLRGHTLLEKAAPCMPALGASQVSAQPPARHLFTLMHMPSLHVRRHRVLAGGCTEATRRARWAHCPRRAAASPRSARVAHPCHAARRGNGGSLV